MAGAVQAFGEAAASYRKNLKDYLLYSILMGMASGALSLILFAVLLVAGTLVIGSLSSLTATGNFLTVNALWLGTTILFLLAGLLIFAWLASGLNGAYIDTMAGFLTGKKQSVGGFFKPIPRLATPILGVAILCGIIIGLPSLAVIYVFSLMGGLIALFGIALAAAYVVFMSLLLVFSAPAVIMDGSRPLAAMRHSVSVSAKNILSVISFAVMVAVLSLPSLVAMAIPALLATFTSVGTNIVAVLLVLSVLFSLFYKFLFSLPLEVSALLSLYRKAR